MSDSTATTTFRNTTTTMTMAKIFDAKDTRFTGALISAAKKTIPGGFRQENAQGWNKETERLFTRFEQTGDNGAAEELAESLDNARREKWRKTVESMSFKKIQL